jgi:hypothetical protein
MSGSAFFVTKYLKLEQNMTSGGKDFFCYSLYDTKVSVFACPDKGSPTSVVLSIKQAASRSAVLFCENQSAGFVVAVLGS